MSLLEPYSNGAKSRLTAPFENDIAFFCAPDMTASNAYDDAIKDNQAVLVSSYPHAPYHGRGD